jgi:hypothetical protein
VEGVLILNDLSRKCKACVATTLLEAKREQELIKKLKRCVQCFQDLPEDQFSKRQYVQLDGKCKPCIAQLERDAAKSSSTLAGKWAYDQFYRCCHRGKTGGVGVRTKCNIASPILGTIPLGRVFRGTQVVVNEQGDPMVKLESLAVVHQPRTATIGDKLSNDSGDVVQPMKSRDGWVPCRSIRNEIFIERHMGPWLASETSPPESVPTRFFRCVIEGCKVRSAPDLELVEIGYVLYGDVVEVVACRISDDGVVFLRLHDRYFDGLAWVVERTLDNESVLNQVDGPSSEPAQYRCVQDGGAPTRHEPSLSAPPVGRIPCGTTVTVLDRVVTPERHIFLRLEPRKSKHQAAQDLSPLWVIETSTVCASVMVRCSTIEKQQRRFAL